MNTEKIKTQELILNTAYNLLVEKGYANVFTRDIAEGAGVALSQLNYYYKTKEKLFVSIIDIVIKKLVEELKEVFSEGTSRRDCFIRMAEYFKRIIARQPGMMKLLIDFTTQSMWVKSLKVHIYGLFRELNIMIQKYIIKDNVGQTTFKNCPTEYVAEVVIFAVIGMTLHVILGEKDVYHLKSDTLANMLFDDETPVNRV